MRLSELRLEDPQAEPRDSQTLKTLLRTSADVIEALQSIAKVPMSSLSRRTILVVLDVRRTRYESRSQICKGLSGNTIYESAMCLFSAIERITLPASSNCLLTNVQPWSCSSVGRCVCLNVPSPPELSRFEQRGRGIPHPSLYESRSSRARIGL